MTRVVAVLVAGSLVFSSPIGARTLEEILSEKGVLTADEAAEAAKTSDSTSQPTPAVAAWLARITPSADIRVRWEGFVREGDPDRNRARVRWRLGAKLALTDEMETGFRIASGDPDDPVSTNQSFSDTFSTKQIGIDTAYLKITPVAALGLERPLVTFYGGKFDMPVFLPTETIFDSDLRPEGFHEVLSLYQKEGTSLDLQVAQWSAEEVSSGSDAWVFGGQLVARLPVAEGLTVAVGDFGFQEADLLAVERNGNRTLAITNDVRLSDGTVVGGRKIDPSREGPNGDGVGADGQPLRIVGFADDFNVFNVAAELGVDSGAPRWPLLLVADYARNLEAGGGDDTAFILGVEAGSSRKPGEISAGYLYGRKETNSVVSSLTFSDFGPDGGTNVHGHVISIGVGLLEGLTGLTTLYVTEPIDDVPGSNTSTAYRFQIDLLARF